VCDEKAEIKPDLFPEFSGSDSEYQKGNREES